MAAILPFLYFRSIRLALLVLAVVITGCSGTRRLPDDAALFTGYKVQVKNEGDSSNRQKELETELTATVKPEPNMAILGLRPKLWIYNTFYTEKKKGIKHWIQNKLGEPPVLISQVDTTSLNTVMSTRLHNRGYFNNYVVSKTTIKNKKATIDWTATVSEPYRIRKVEYTLEDTTAIQSDIEKELSRSILIPGEPYDLQNMTAERVRIGDNLKNIGYYYFSPEMLIFSVDTTIGNRQADVLMRIKQTAPDFALQPYAIDDVYIMANYSIGDSLSVSDTLNYKGYYYIPNENYVRARHLLYGLFLEKDSLYSRVDHLLTINRLAGLPAYKFVNLNYERDTISTNKLDAFIYLTPAFKKSLRLEASYVSKSNNFSGPGITASFQNRNAFKGSELLSLEITGNFESQIGGRGTGETQEGETTNSNLSSYELGAQASLTIPRIMSPFNLPNLRTEFVPKTRFALGFNFLNRVQYFQMNSFNASYAYNWRPKPTITYDITPINLQFVKLGKTTEIFDSLLVQNQFLRRSFEEQFIVGSIYQFTYSNQMLAQRTHHFFNNVTLDVSGNLVNGLHTLLGAEKRTEEKSRTLVGQPFSQYTKVENDFRYYFNIGKESQLATRLIAGLGYAYGNSRTMPYVKQFSIGGPNSIRAFRARSIGPGTYNVPESLVSVPDSLIFSYFEQTGDIKLEANIEYRFPISGFFKGALFVDAGNIWLVRETINPRTGKSDKPGGTFEAKDFLGELAVGTGFGLRIDVDFFVIRFDFGIPVRVPYLPKGEQNLLSKFRPTFKGENGMVLNIAIGYPF